MSIKDYTSALTESVQARIRDAPPEDAPTNLLQRVQLYVEAIYLDCTGIEVAACEQLIAILIRSPFDKTAFQEYTDVALTRWFASGEMPPLLLAWYLSLNTIREFYDEAEATNLVSHVSHIIGNIVLEAYSDEGIEITSGSLTNINELCP